MRDRLRGRLRRGTRLLGIGCRCLWGGFVYGDGRICSLRGGRLWSYLGFRSFCIRSVCPELRFAELQGSEQCCAVVDLDFTGEERKKYDVLEREAKGLLGRIEQGEEKGYSFVLELLLRMRQFSVPTPQPPHRNSPPQPSSRMCL